jgi:hypothetical protein
VKSTKVHVIQCYHPVTGELEGYLTDRDTITDQRQRAVEYHHDMESLAQAHVDFLSQAAGYRAFVWVVDEQSRVGIYPLRERAPGSGAG